MQKVLVKYFKILILYYLQALIYMQLREFGLIALSEPKSILELRFKWSQVNTVNIPIWQIYLQ